MDQQALVAGAIAGLLTVFELDRTFYIPTAVRQKITLNAWWWGFVAANGLLAVWLFTIVSGLEILQGMNQDLKGPVIGLGYMALVRLKVVTIKLQGTELPVGFDGIYEGAKAFFFRRINSIARTGRILETTDLAKRMTLVALASQVRLSIEQDALIADEEKRLHKTWLLKVLNDANASDFERRAALADYLLSGHRSSDFV